MSNERTEAIIDSLLNESPSIPCELLNQSNLLTLARARRLTLTESSADVATQAFKDRLMIFGDINSITSSDTATYSPAIHDLIAHQSHDLIQESDAVTSLNELSLLNSLSGKASMVVDTRCLITHQNDNNLFNLTTTNRMNEFVSFIKTDNIDNKLSLIDYGLASIHKQEANLVQSDAESIAISFVNLASDKSYTALLDKSEIQPDVAAVMFSSVGKPFAENLYAHTKATDHDKYAISLLTHPRHGWLVGGGDPNSSSYIKSLMAIVAKSNDSELHLDRIISLSDNTETTTSVIETLIDAHNNIYDTTNISTLINKVGGRLSSEQINRISNLLLKSCDTQPVLGSLQAIADLNKSKGYDVEHLETAMQAIKDRMSSDFSSLDKPISQYSTTSIDFTGVNDSVYVSAAQSTPHLQLMIDDMLSGYKGDVTFTISATDTALDQSVKKALEQYLFKDNAYDLNKLISTPIRETEKTSSAKWSQLLFEAAKQEKSKSPILPSDTINNLSAIADENKFLTISSSKTMKSSRLPLNQLKTSNDILDVISSDSADSFKLDTTGLGKAYDKALSGAITDLLSAPSDNKHLSALDDLLGLPIERLSTNIEINHSSDDKKVKINNILSVITKNPLSNDKVTDSNTKQSTRTPD